MSQKTTFRGPGITVNAQFTSTVNHFKQSMAGVSEGLPVREFKPLVVKPHPRQDEIDAFKAIPSRQA